MHRRSFLCAVMVASSSLAGCATRRSANDPTVTRTSPYASENSSENVEEPRGITISNGDDERYDLTIEVRDGDDVIFRNAYEVEPDDSETVPAVVAKKGEYAVEASLADGTRASRTWKVGTAYSGVDVVINDGEISITQTACDPSC